MKKKTLSLFLVLIMCLSLMPAGVFAQDAVQEQTPEQTETVIDPEQQEPDAEQEESAGVEQDEEEAHVSENDAVATLQAMIDDLPEQVTEENADAVTAQLAAIEDAMEDMTDEQLDKLEADRYEAAVEALAQLGGEDTPAIMAAANAVTKYDLWVGGVQVTSENKDNIPGVYSGKASYDPDTKILTLDNATINKTGAFKESYATRNSAIYCLQMYGNYNKPVVEKIELIGSNRVTYTGNWPTASGTFSMIYAECNYFTITGTGSLEVTAGDCTSDLPFYSNAIYCSGRLTIDNTTVTAYSGNSNAVDRDNSAISSGYYGGDLILKNAKVTSGSKRKMTNQPASSSGFKYSELKDYRTLTIVPTDGHEHYICGGQYKCNATHAEESSLTKFTEWSNASELPKDAGSYYLTTDVTLSEAWTPTADINLCLNGHKISGPDGSDVIFVTNGREVTVSDCGSDTAASSEARIYHEDGASGNGVKVAGGGHIQSVRWQDHLKYLRCK